MVLRVLKCMAWISLCWTLVSCGSLRNKRDKYPQAFVRTFLRDSVEQIPPVNRYQEKSAFTELDSYGSKSLPLRNAVEQIPEKYGVRLPLRDAVERRPSPNEPYTDDHYNPYDVDLDLDLNLEEYRHVARPQSPRPASLKTSYQSVYVYSRPFRTNDTHQELLHQGEIRKKRDTFRYLRAKQNLHEQMQIKMLDETVNGYRVVCYVEGMAAHRKAPLAYTSHEVDPFACTHIIYGFANLDPQTYKLVAQDKDYDIVKGGFRDITSLKLKNPELKVMISIGGSSLENSKHFSEMVSVSSKREDFIRSVVDFLDEYKFDGVDLYWQYPGDEEHNGKPTDKVNFELLLDEMFEVFNEYGYLLSVAVPASRFRVEDGFNVKTIGKMVNFLNLQAFDFHSEKDKKAENPAPLLKRKTDKGVDMFFNVDYAVKYWLKRGVSRDKINLGIPFHGRSFKLKFLNETMDGAAIEGLGKQGDYTKTPGLLAYFEICDKIMNEGWHTDRDSVGSSYAYMKDQWVGYDDPRAVDKKLTYIKDMGLGGASVWAIDLDDFQGLCGDKYPLLARVKKALRVNEVEVASDVGHKPAGLCDREGLYSNPRDCFSYYVCRGGLSYHMTCDSHKLFDTRTGKCGHIAPELCKLGTSVHVSVTTKSLDDILKSSRLTYASKAVSGPKMVCYMTNWSFYRKGEGKFVPEHINQQLCSHVVYAFASLEPENLLMKEFDPWADLDNDLYGRTTSLHDTTVLLALGGWTDSTGDKYSRLVNDGSARRKFVVSVVSFLRRHGFKGLHLDWNYPVCWQSNCKKGPAADRAGFTKLAQELRQEFDRQSPPLVLAAAISGYKEIIDVAYDLPALGEVLDFMSVMTYDYHGHWERKTGHVSPLYQRKDDAYPQYNSNYTMEYLVSRGAPREKLLMGIPFYGQTFTLSRKDSKYDPGVAASGPGEAGEFSKQPGMLAYYEICHRVKQQKWTVMRDGNGATGPYAYSKDQWVGYEDPDSVMEKAKYITQHGFGGAVAWTIDLDDFSNRCCREPFPLLHNLNRGLGRLTDSPPAGGDCTRPREPVTPPAPTLTTGVDSGASTSAMSSTTWPSWMPSTTEHVHQHPQASPTRKTTTTSTTTTTAKTTTSWWQRPSESTTTSPWWTSGKPTTTSPWWVPSTTPSTTAAATTTTTLKPWTIYHSTTTQSSSTTEKPSWTVHHTTTERVTSQGTTIPSPAVIQPDSAESPTGEACESGTYLADPLNCNAYYHCVLGERKKQFCAGGLHWNSNKLVCDWPSESKCVESKPVRKPVTERPPHTASPVTTVRTTTTTTSPTTKRTTTLTTRHTTTTSPTTTTTHSSTTGQAPSHDTHFEADGECSSGQHYSHEQCTHFYVCVNGILVEQKCGPGLMWNPQLKFCDWTFNVHCKTRKKMPSTPHSATNHQHVQVPKAKCTMGSYASHTEDCGKYMMCLYGQYETYSCAAGLHWNKDRQICDWPASAKCEKGIPDQEMNGPEVLVPGTPETPEVVTKPSHKSTTRMYTTSTAATTTTTTTTPAPSTSTEPLEPLSGYFKVVCYFTNWAWYRRGIGKYLPENIDPNLCTHIVYGFAVLDYERLVIKAHDSWADFDNKFYTRVTAYKKKGLKVSLALGGWNDSAGDKYSRLVNNPQARARFITHAIEFMEKYDFDGLDLDWEYPKCWQVDCKKGPDSDKAAFAAFVKELSAALKPKGLLLSAAVSPSKTVIDAGYDVPVLGKYLDWVAVMTYDYHGQWDKKTGHVAPLYLHPEDEVTFFNANYSINYWINNGVPRRNIIMGMPLYGQSFQLEKASNNGLNARAPGPGQAGKFTRAAGFLAYYEICDLVKNQGWTMVQDPEQRMGPYAYKGNQWVSFDDVAMIKRKSEFIRKMDLGGGMIWALDLDDFRNRCGEGPHPLLTTIRETLRLPGTGVSELPVHIPTELEQKKPPMKTPPMKTPPMKTPPMKTPPKVETSTVAVVGPQTSTQPALASPYKVVCYFTNWAWYRQSGGKYLPADIDPDLCTHIVYGFAVLDGDKLVIKPHDSWADFDNKFYEKVTAYRAKGIKVLIAIGGWNDSAGDKYSRLVNNPASRRRFTEHVIEFMTSNNFDGLDLDWEYPKCWQVDCNKGPDTDKQAFAAFVRELREAFTPRGLLLSAAVSASKKVVDAGYDIPALSRDLDWISVMAYDYHGQWDKITGHVAPMYVHPDDVDVTFNANFSINYWIEMGADKQKLVMGMPMYGQSFSLADNSQNGLNAPTYGGGEAGEATRARGFLSYYEICSNVQKKGWQVVRDNRGRMGPYAYLRDQWVSFDDIAMIRHKSEYIRAMGLGGGMIWALDLDDFRNSCGCEEYPLLRTINRVLRGYNKPDPRCELESMAVQPTTARPYNTYVTTAPAANEIPGSAGSAGGAAGSCNGRQFVADEVDCNKYYQCDQGQLLPQRCPSGLYWNKDRCDWPENTECHMDRPPAVDKPPKPVVTVPTTQKPPKKVTPKPVEVAKPSHPGTAHQPEPGNKVICYFTNWAWYRQGDGKYKPEDIDTDLCTHINYGFAVLDSNTLTIKPHDSWADIDNDFYRKVTMLKAKGIKVLIALGGWNDSLGNKYSRLVNDPQARARFITHAVQFMEKYGFDGLDLDWEYPKCWQVDCTKGPDSDKAGFAALVKELSAVLRPKGLLLSAAVSPSKMVIDAGYDVPTLASHFDWIAVMTYDFHGHWDKQTGHVAPLYHYPGDTYDYFNSNFSLHYWMEKGAPANKLVMGMPLYGQSFSLADTSNRGLNAKSYGPGEAGEFTRAGGFLAFYEICDRVKKRGWQVDRDPQGRIGPFAYQGNQWVSYDDVADIRRKARFARQMGLAGGMVWALDLDDFRDRCGCGKNPLLRMLNHELRGLPVSRTTDCT